MYSLKIREPAVVRISLSATLLVSAKLQSIPKMGTLYNQSLNFWHFTQQLLRWLDAELHTSFRTSGSPHKPSRDFSMLA